MLLLIVPHLAIWLGFHSVRLRIGATQSTLPGQDRPKLVTPKLVTSMRQLGHLRRLGDVRTTSGFPPITAEKGGHSGLAAAQNEPSFTLIQSGSVPKAIEFFLDPPADAPPA